MWCQDAFGRRLQYRLNRQDGQDVSIELVVEATGAVEEVLANTAITGATYDIDGRQQFVA